MTSLTRHQSLGLLAAAAVPPTTGVAIAAQIGTETMLTDLISKYEQANAAFKAACAAFPNIDHDELFDAKEAAELAAIRAPCCSLDDVRAKARWALADDMVYDSLRNCIVGGGDRTHALVIFLRSLLSEAPVENNVDSGDKA